VAPENGGLKMGTDLFFVNTGSFLKKPDPSKNKSVPIFVFAAFQVFLRHTITRCIPS
jgi:hypothetical protein